MMIPAHKNVSYRRSVDEWSRLFYNLGTEMKAVSDEILKQIEGYLRIFMEVLFLENLLERLKEYLQMEDTISFEEFSGFYNELIEELNQSFDHLDQDARIKALYICSVVQSNADSRIRESKSTAKAFKKMSAKSGFWKDAIKFHLGKNGMTAQEIEQATEAINSGV